MKEKRHVRHQIGWIALGLLAICLRWLLGGHPEFIERYYSRGLFLGIRWIIDYLFAWLPIPLIYLFFLTLFFLAARGVHRSIQSTAALRQKALQSLLSGMAFLGAITFAFFLLWGYNYSRLPIEDQLELDIGPLSLEELKAELDLETAYLLQLRPRIPGAGERALDITVLPAQLEKQLRAEVEHRLRENGFPAVGRVRARRLYPRGIFLRFSSSGLYFPLTGEGHVDAGVHPLQLPYIMAHEMSHGQGFGDEGTCNFLAYLSCSQSSDPFIAYAGHLSYWRTLAANYLRYEPEAYQNFRAALPAEIQADLDAINKTLLQYPDIMPRLRYYAYDTYLKSQGIKEGMLNYNRVLMLVHAWKAKRAEQIEKAF